jgi:RNA polymerase sigma-70 factor, ECF subfamily
MAENQEFKSIDKASMESFISLLTAHQHRVYTYIMSRVPRKSDADDIMQETTLTMWRKFGEFEEGTDFRAWGFTIAHYCIMSFRKKQKTLCFHLSDEAIQAIDSDSKDNTKDNDARINALNGCIKKLTPSSQQLLLMRYNQEVPAKTIAVRIGKSVPYVYKALAKIHEFLLRCVRRTLVVETTR